jgi:peptidoglycan/LPS O-acetylase OafA/YrhL
MSAPAPAERYHALDSLRGFAMLLGVVLHAAISFMATPPAFWPVRDNDPTPLADFFLLAIHGFRMQLFFLLAGFFGCLLYRKYGLVGMTLHRLKRVGIPFVLGLVFIVPTVVVAALFEEVENVRAGGVPGPTSPVRQRAAELVAANPDASSAQLVADFFTTAPGDSHASLPLIHLWFLYYLLIFIVVVAVLEPLLGRLTGTRLLARIDAAFQRVIDSPWRVLVLALLTFPLMLPMTWIVDTPLRWNPQWHVVGYYFAFFGFGWMLYRHLGLVPVFGRGWGINLAVANGAVLPVMTGVIITGFEESQHGADPFWWQFGGFAVSVLYTWLMITGLWGAFLRLFTREFARVRYLADSSYWCYLASITPIMVFQFVVKDWPLPWPVKSALVTGATMGVLLASYEWFVRYTFIGAILNGRKYRKSAAATEKSLMVVAEEEVEEAPRV